MASSPAAAVTLPPAEEVAALQEARERTLALIASVSDADLERVHSNLMSPLVWDLGHIAAFEDLWLVHRYGGRPLLREDLAEVYDAFETPRAHRGDLPFLGPAQARDYMRRVREGTLEVIEERGIGNGILHEMVLRHEHQHNETMLQTIQLARLPDYRLPARRPAPLINGPALTGLEFVEVPAGECTIGARGSGFAYDNERPRHRTDVRGYQIAHSPISNATFLTFVEGGGYRRREWWSDEGWAWKEQYDITRPGAWTANLNAEWRIGSLEPLDPHRPVVHVSWFEADAFARAHGARLPTEIEWEKAATWDQDQGTARRFPWANESPAPGVESPVAGVESPVAGVESQVAGVESPIPGVHANVDQLGGGPHPGAAYPEGASPYGCLGMIGDVWEWTASPFRAYPGFAPFPYREYSEVFFGDEYRVLRGGSWATRARVARPTFRNWDFPQRRQIFAGFRLARDL